MNTDRWFTRVARTGGAIHTALYRGSGGRVGGRLLRGVPCLLLTVTGRKSGQPRTAPLIYGRDGDDYIIVAAKAGRPTSPVWWLNLRSDPQAEVEIDRERLSVTAEEVTDAEERARLWRLMTQLYPNLDAYQRKTTRVIPVIRLRPGAGAQGGARAAT
ncbi:MAG: nitroreductase family deazaflavin-dependent oxidoreductase [Candidatus Dormibacteria bacterium]